MIEALGKWRHCPEKLPVIVITGFMGTGKTEIAKELSKLMALEFIDTDNLIENLAGRSVSEIIETHGESYFRKLETQVCERLYKKQGAVIATGGGTLLDTNIFQAFSNSGTVVLLEASVESLHERLLDSRTRPLLFPDAPGEKDNSLRDRICSLLKEREEAYGRISFRIDTSFITPHISACRIAAGIDLPSTVLSLHVNKKTIEKQAAAPANRFSPAGSGTIIEVGRGLLSKIGERLKSYGLAENVFVLMPKTTRKPFLAQIDTSLELAEIPFSYIEIKDSENQKTLAQAKAIIDRLIENAAGRDITIVPVGGGVTGDIGGFTASIYMRGVRLVHVPTTLLAQVDSSIGGKVGVNHPSGKNLIGSFYQPDLVLTDPCTLRTLPPEQIANGMAEVVKAALLGSAELFEFIETELSRQGEGMLRNVEFLERCIAGCISIKGAIVEQDPYESDQRRLLNLGHTVGHALEAAHNYRLNHGQAVALGLIAAIQIAIGRGKAEENLLERTLAILKPCGLPVVFPHVDKEIFSRSLNLDKKRMRKKIHFVLPARVGSVEVVDDVTEDEILCAISRGKI